MTTLYKTFLFKPKNYQQIESTGDFCMVTYLQVNKCLGLHHKNKLELEEVAHNIYGEFLAVKVSKVQYIFYLNLYLENVSNTLLIGT